MALRGRRVVLGVSGGIAAYKAVEICRRLVDEGAHVAPVMTADATRFVGAVTLSALASEPVRTSLWDSPEPIPHTHLGQTADAVLVAPATARVIGSYAAGISDGLLVATLLATRAPVVVCPAMHTEMWEHAAVQENVATLRRRGVHIVGPGVGRLAEPDEIVSAVVAAVDAASRRDLTGRTVIVTAGGTREAIDAVRVITNRSSGKQGYALAAEAAARGARVVLVTTVDRPVPPGVAEVVSVASAADMQAAVLPRAVAADIVIMAAAVADFRPAAPAEGKLKKEAGVPQVVLEPTHDFLVDLGTSKPPGQVLVGFAAETDDVEANALRKLRSKRLDLIVANDVGAPGAGFEHDTNEVMILGAYGVEEKLPMMSKADVARAVVDAAVRRLMPIRGASQ